MTWQFLRGSKVFSSLSLSPALFTRWFDNAQRFGRIGRGCRRSCPNSFAHTLSKCRRCFTGDWLFRLAPLLRYFFLLHLSSWTRRTLANERQREKKGRQTQRDIERKTRTSAVFSACYNRGALTCRLSGSQDRLCRLSPDVCVSLFFRYLQRNLILSV